MQRLEEVLHDLAEQDEQLPMSDLITRIERRLSGESDFPVVVIDGKSEMDTHKNTRQTQHQRWSPAVVAAGAALLALIAIGLPILIYNGGESIVADHPTTTMASTTVPPTTATPTTVPPTTVTRSQVAPPTPFVPPEIYPPDGLNLMVVGMVHDGSLDVWQEPGMPPIITKLGPLDTVHSAGEGRELGDSTWWKIDADGTIGWVDSSYLASWASARVDLTPSVVDRYGDLPTERTMEELGNLVATTLTSDGYVSRIAMVKAPAVGNSQSATFDIVVSDPMGLSIALRDLNGQTGWRLRVTGVPGAHGFTLESVEGQPFLHACACWLP